MSKRLQVLLDEAEFERLREAARREGVTVSEWVRQLIRRSDGRGPKTDQSRKLAAVRIAVRHSFPAGDIREMLGEIERGYLR
jgi:macrodomain Ter protein organizer (MatP/YcbG family)